MSIDDVRETWDIEHEYLIDFSTIGEAITIASQRLDSSEVYGSVREKPIPPIYFIVWNMETEIVSQFWLFPDRYEGLNPLTFMWHDEMNG